MKLALMTGFVLISFSHFASASPERYFTACDPMELLEGKTECIPPNYEEQDGSKNTQERPEHESSTDNTLEQIENKH